MQKAILDCVKSLKKSELANETIRSLNRYAQRIYYILRVRLTGVALLVARALFVNDGNINELPNDRKLQRQIYEYDGTLAKGVPNQTYYRTYTKRVQRAMEEIAKATALDPDDLTGRNSLRNKAEMTARNDYHGKQLDDFKGKGVNLVVCSVHSDCSKRCAPWQGKIYSLDGTSGTTADGRKYIPLSTATDIYATTKAGKVWKNGLLGFNCRHKLYEYREGITIPRVSERERRKDYAITERQRQYERAIRELKAERDTTLDAERRKKDRAKITALTEKYIKFSKKNNRAFYPDRIKII